MYIADIVFLVIAFIICIFGFKKGLLKRITALISWIGAILLTSVLHDPLLAEFLNKDSIISLTNTLDGFNLKLTEWFLSKGSIFNESLIGHNEESISTALDIVGIPSFLHGYFHNGVSDALSSSIDYTLASFFANIISVFALSIIIYVVLFLLLFIVLRLIAHYIDKLRDVFLISFLDGVLGAIYSLVKYVFVLSLVFLLFTFLVNGTALGKTMYDFLSPYMGFEEEAFSISKYLFYENPIIKLISLISFDDLIDKII